MSPERERKNVAASIQARLLVRARKAGEDYQVLFAAFVTERFLYRLGTSSVADRFVLKGAMLLRLWSENPYRATRDLDLLRRGDGAQQALRADLETICSVPVEPDGIEFDATTIKLEAMTAAEEYVGTRATLLAHSGRARQHLQVDMGLGDAVFPPPEPRGYPALLKEFPAPIVLAYAPDTVVAEKLEAILVLGDRNSRIKDFFDLRYIAENFEFERSRLTEAIGQTLARRGTPIPTDDPLGLTAAYWDNPSRPMQTRAFARRAGLDVDTSSGAEILAVIRPFLLPILGDLRRGVRTEGTWKPRGPWR